MDAVSVAGTAADGADDALELLGEAARAPAAVFSPASLQDVSTPEGAGAAGRWPSSALAYLALEWLADHAGDPAIFDYYRRLPDAGSRDEAFEGAFGLTLAEFYEEFEAFRATLRAE